MPPMKSNPLVPELYVSDFNISLDFYVTTLGFKVEYRRKDPLFAFLSYQGSQLMIQEIEPDWQTGKLEYPYGRGINFQIKTTNLDELINQLRNANWPLQYGPEENSYKTLQGVARVYEFNVMDPDGYLLRFSQNIKRF